MKVILVTCSDDRMGRKGGLYSKTQVKIESLFKNSNFGVTDYLTLTWENIEASEFYQNNKALLSNVDPAKNGRAYKPYAISEGLKLINDGDFLIYTDSSPEMWNIDEVSNKYDLNILKNLCVVNRGILTAFVKWDTRPIPEGSFGIHTHENFTTDRCIRTMGLQQYAKSYMGASGMVVICKSDITTKFVDEWLMWNCNENCCSLGISDIQGDYSFWDEEDGRKMGHRSDQSILGLLLCKYNYNMVDILHTDLSPYNFLNFCTPYNHTFINPNTVLDEPRRIRKGDIVINKQGHELTVFEVWPEDGIETLVVGLHKQSCFKITSDNVILK